MNFKEIENYITEIQDAERTFRHPNVNDMAIAHKSIVFRVLKQFYLLMLSFFDFIYLYILLKTKKQKIRDKRIVFTGRGSCFEIDGKLEDRIVRPFFTDNILFINSQKSNRINKINNQKVFNLGSLVKVISILFFRKIPYKMRIFQAYSTVNNIIFKNLSGNEVYVICLWEMNTLSIIFSKYRSNIKLVKVQHGSMIDYPPYIKPAPVKIADLIYVKNKPTIEFLKTHLCAMHPTEYKLIPYPATNRKYVPGVHLLYASTIEINGLHPVFKKFLEQNKSQDLHVIIRLHPREQEKEMEFKEALLGYIGKFEFDNSKNWMENNYIENLIVISPWSSVLEDAYDNGFISITIDPVGYNRFRFFIDNKRFFYSEDIAETLQIINMQS